SAAPSPRSWPSAESQQLRLPQFNWRPENLPSQNMRMFSPTFDDQFSRQTNTSTYGGTEYNLHTEMESHLSGHLDDAGMMRDQTGQSPILTMHEESPQPKSEMPDAYHLDDEEMHDLVPPAAPSEGD